jgi:hypothetical protein
MLRQLRAAVAAAGLCGTVLGADAQPSMEPFRALLGTWQCSGSFAASGKPIAAHISVEEDRPTQSFIVRHDDLPPNAFHDLEVWGPAGSAYRASIADQYSGIRWLTSAGWQAGVLDWTRQENGAPAERFRYSNATGQGFDLQWFVFKNGEAHLGDSLSCHRA